MKSGRAGWYWWGVYQTDQRIGWKIHGKVSDPDLAGRDVVLAKWKNFFSRLCRVLFAQCSSSLILISQCFWMSKSHLEEALHQQATAFPYVCVCARFAFSGKYPSGKCSQQIWQNDDRSDERFSLASIGLHDHHLLDFTIKALPNGIVLNNANMMYIFGWVYYRTSYCNETVSIKTRLSEKKHATVYPSTCSSVRERTWACIESISKCQPLSFFYEWKNKNYGVSLRKVELLKLQFVWFSVLHTLFSLTSLLLFGFVLVFVWEIVWFLLEKFHAFMILIDQIALWIWIYF